MSILLLFAFVSFISVVFIVIWCFLLMSTVDFVQQEEKNRNGFLTIRRKKGTCFNRILR